MKILFLIGLTYTFFQVNSQQTPRYSLDDLETENFVDVLFNRKNLNPSTFDDSATIHINGLLNLQWVGYNESPTNTTISAESNLFKSTQGLGFLANLSHTGDNVIKKQSYQIFYKYRILSTNTLIINTGIGLGVLNHKVKYQILFDDKLIIDNIYSYPINIGGEMMFKSHKLGIAINNYFLNTELRNSSGEKQNGGLINLSIDYSYNLRLNSKLNLLPEFVLIKDKGDTYYFLSTILQIKNNFKTGVFFDSKAFGLMISGEIFKFIEVGYSYEYINSKYDYGSHTIKLGFKIWP